MKIFIVFLAILILNISFLTFQGDMGRYLRTQNTVKAIAEECGAGAALFFEASEFADGYLVANTGEALKHITYIIDNSKSISALALSGKADWQADFFDDSLVSRTYLNGELVRAIPFTFPYYYRDDKGQEIVVKGPSVIVTISLATEDFFRLPFLESRELARSAMYELKSKNN